MGFTGNYAKKFDNRQHRAAVPAIFREVLGDRFIICKAPVAEKCIFCYTEETWEEILREVEQQNTSEFARRQQRMLCSNALTVVPDKQGRITISELLCNLTDIHDIEEVLFIGVGKHVEIWNPKCFYEEMNKPVVDDSDESKTLEIHY